MAENKGIRAVCLVLGFVMLLSCMALGVSAETTYVASAGGIGYSTVAEAVTNANGQMVKLLADSGETVTAVGDLYLDLNGHTLAGLNISGGSLYGMDSATDDYDCTDGYGKILKLTGSCAAHHKTDITGSIRRYMTVENDDAVSFHRFYLGITHASLKPINKGVGYKAVFAGDQLVLEQLNEAEAFGYELCLDSNMAVSCWKPRQAFESLKEVTLRVENYDAAKYGETKLSAKAQLKLTDGTVITSNEYANSLRGITEMVNKQFADYSRGQLSAMAAWITGEPKMGAWDVENILNPKCVVTFYDADGITVLATQTVSDGGVAVPPDMAAEDFLGWSGTWAGVTQHESVYAVYADSANVFYLGNGAGSVGDTVTVDLWLDGSVKLNGFELFVRYDDALEFGGIMIENADGDVLFSKDPEVLRDEDVIPYTEMSDFVANYDPDANEVICVYSAARNTTKHYQMLTMQFTIKQTDAQCGRIWLVMNDIAQYSEEPVEYALLDGVVTIQ